MSIEDSVTQSPANRRLFAIVDQSPFSIQIITPDGYTILMAVMSSHAVAPATKKVPPFDPIADFTPISGISTFANIIAVNSGSNYRTIEMLIVAAAWYFVVIALLTVVQHALEKRIAER